MKSSSWNLSFSWNSAKEIFSATDQLIQKTLSRHNTIATLPKLQYSFDSVFSLLALAENEFKAEADAIQFMKYVSDSKEVRDASQVATQKLDEFEIEASMRRDLYEVLCATSSLVDRTQLSLEDQRYMDRWLMDCKRNGLHLPSQQQDEVKALKKKIALLCTQFSCTKNADTTCLTLTHDELDGLPDSYFASLTPGSTSPTPTYKITMSYPDRLPILRKAKRETTRQRLYQTIHTMCPDNVQVLNTLIELRHQVAQLLGYATHADYILEPKMAKSAQAVHDFLLDLQTQLTPLGKKEYQRLLLLKNKERKEKGLDPVSELYQWDFNYYHTQLMETTYNVDQEAIKPYFSMEAVTQGRFGWREGSLFLKNTHPYIVL
ncbi:Thimet oligopeptidase [Coelomomyces lativittatus]|nr:Thimet oligopeptidase [Coelomomyces lativittatus]